jgi:hypothetical protein
MEGYVYCLSNESMHGLLKIGMTRRTPEDRVKELYTIGVPAKFKIEYARKVNNPREVERNIHKELKQYRVENREFFKINVTDAIAAFNKVIPESNLNTQDAKFIKMTEDIKTNIFQLITNYTNEEKNVLIKGIDKSMNSIFNTYCNEKTEKNTDISKKINDKKKYQIIELLREFGGVHNTIKAINSVAANTIVNEELEFINKINNIGIDEILKEYNINESMHILWYIVLNDTIIISNDDNICVCDKEYVDPINITYVSYNIFKTQLLDHCSEDIIKKYRQMLSKCLKYCRSELNLSSANFPNLIKIGIYNDDDSYILKNRIIDDYILDDN